MAPANLAQPSPGAPQLMMSSELAVEDRKMIISRLMSSTVEVIFIILLLLFYCGLYSGSTPVVEILLLG